MCSCASPGDLWGLYRPGFGLLYVLVRLMFRAVVLPIKCFVFVACAWALAYQHRQTVIGSWPPPTLSPLNAAAANDNTFISLVISLTFILSYFIHSFYFMLHLFLWKAVVANCPNSIEVNIRYAVLSIKSNLPPPLSSGGGKGAASLVAVEHNPQNFREFARPAHMWPNFEKWTDGNPHGWS